MKLDRTVIEQSPLTELQKKYLIMIDVDGHRVVEVAKLLNRGKSSVSVGHARALRKFNGWLAEAEGASGMEGGAGIYFCIGELERMYEWMQRAYDERDNMIPDMRWMPELEGLQADARFLDFMKRVGL